MLPTYMEEAEKSRREYSCQKKRTQIKVQKTTRDTELQKEREKLQLGVARGFCAFGYWSDRNRGDVECCRYPTDSEEGYERIF